jgi:uncharacterized damage-inducible protein DinB
MELAECRALLGHCEWADAQVWAPVLALAEPDAEIRERMHHLHLVQWTYLQIWRGGPVKASGLDEFPTASALRAWAREYYRELTSYLGTVGVAVVTEVVRFPWANRLSERFFGKAKPVTWSDSVLQVAMHSAHHRGQVVRRLRQLGAEPPLTDFIGWVWQERPVAQWGDDDAA